MKIVCGCGHEMKNQCSNASWLQKDGKGDPYKLWYADVMKCPLCGNVIYRLANVPYAESFQPTFVTYLEYAKDSEHFKEEHPAPFKI